MSVAISVNLTPIVTGYNLSKINDNFTAIKNALADALSRSGTSVNTMSADLDMNGNSILNLESLDVQELSIGGSPITDELFSKGDPGDAATITVGTVTTGAAGSNASVTNVGTDQDAIFNFTIPRGATGSPGDGSGDMLAANNLSDVSDASTSFNNIKQSATTSVTGVVELATTSETTTGTDTVRAVTPAGVKAATDALSSTLSASISAVEAEIAPAVLAGQQAVAGINSQTGTSYTLVLTDAGKIVELSNASSITVTIPPNSSVAFLTNTVIDFTQMGAGQVSFSAGVGVTIRSSASKVKLTGQYSGATIYKRGTNEWVLVGDLSA